MTTLCSRSSSTRRFPPASHRGRAGTPSRRRCPRTQSRKASPRSARLRSSRAPSARRRRRVRTGGRRHSLRRGRRHVAGGVERRDTERVRRRAHHAGHREARRRGRTHLRAVAEHPIARHRNVVRRRRPRERCRRLTHGTRAKTGGCRRRDGIRARSRRHTCGRRGRRVARCVDRRHTQDVGRSTREPGVRERRARRRPHLRTAAEEPVPDHPDVVRRCRPRQCRRGLPDCARREPVGVDGADVSGHAVVVTVVVAVADTLPAASSATTPSVYDVPHSMPVTVKLVDDDVPTCVPERKHPIARHRNVVRRRRPRQRCRR